MKAETARPMGDMWKRFMTEVYREILKGSHKH
jgi:hypothetical protein